MKKSIAVMLCCVVALCSGCSLLGGESGGGSDDMTSDSSMTEKISLTITQGTGEVFPYAEQVKNYLQAPAGANVADYVFATNNQAQGIKLAWACSGIDSVQSFLLRYGVKGSEESEWISVELSGDTKEYELFNLYKNTQYDWSVTATLESGETLTAEESFQTTALGPRTLSLLDAYNTRDVGGWATESGGTTKQGLMFRGGELPAALRMDAKKALEPLGIKTELDLRGFTEESGFRTQSPIPNATLQCIVTDGYMGAFRLTENFRQVFSLMADEANYPMYVHCTGGADRTGTVIFLVNALLGVSEADLIKDFEFTSFSRYGERNSAAGTQYGDMFQSFLIQLKTYEGDTLAEKTANYMRSIGVTETEIESIRSIMLEK